MDTFAIKGQAGFIKITFDEVYGFPDSTCYWGGYDSKAALEISSINVQVKSTFFTSTGEIFEFFQKLKECNSKLTGTATYNSYEHDLSIAASYDELGHVNIVGKFKEQHEFDYELKFEFTSDQSFIKYTVDELELIVDKYGDMKGVKK